MFVSSISVRIQCTYNVQISVLSVYIGIDVNRNMNSSINSIKRLRSQYTVSSLDLDAMYIEWIYAYGVCNRRPLDLSLLSDHTKMCTTLFVFTDILFCESLPLLFVASHCIALHRWAENKNYKLKTERYREREGGLNLDCSVFCFVKLHFVHTTQYTSDDKQHIRLFSGDCSKMMMLNGFCCLGRSIDVCDAITS